jgi:hypothetical protein
MASKNNRPDAKAMPIQSLGMALKQGGGTNEQSKVERLHDSLNGAGSKGKGYAKLGVSGAMDIKTDIAIPSAGAQKSKVAKQMSENKKISKKQKGE